ncbi:hypothetical protein BJ322DRAFT_1098471 [Thelephora terrestris]|uniref:DNA-directed RNA polymerase RpoA/D/Rpb3-type domain-containing protein n=1 Tax=Thelephora terrestris TaxID=56493 RepID=A0A9P6HNA7_9AGAM|nr:hypothetical protein BJ322DRAFT_1098471 [Thelephora terrestris]
MAPLPSAKRPASETFTSTFNKTLYQRSTQFYLVGVDASIANAFRRILIAEVSTIAIKHVYAWDNTSVIQDEVLAQRIGLVPLDVDSSYLEFQSALQDQAADRHTLVFRFDVTCTRKPQAASARRTKKAEPEPGGIYNHSLVMSGDLNWEPQGEQSEGLASNPPRSTNENIEVHAKKGWSPVATATNHLLPLVILNPEKPKFRKRFSPGVIDVDPVTKAVNEENRRNETMSREVLRHKEFKGCVGVRRTRALAIRSSSSSSPRKNERLWRQFALENPLALMRPRSHQSGVA